MKEIIICLIIFIVIYLSYFLFVIRRKKAFDKFRENTYFKYLMGRYKLNPKKMNNKALAHQIALSNAFIIATTFGIISMVENMLLKLIFAIVILIPFQLFIYHIIGKFEKRREEHV